MKKVDILTLAKAGFTAAQIAALSKIQEEPKTEPKTEEQKSPENKTDPAPGTDEALLKAIEGLGVKIEGMNINASNQPEVETADQILASIINPKEVSNGKE